MSVAWPLLNLRHCEDNRLQESLESKDRRVFAMLTLQKLKIMWQDVGAANVAYLLMKFHRKTT